MTPIQKFEALDKALYRNANEVAKVHELRSLFPEDRDLLFYHLRLAKEREYIIAEFNKLPKHISA
jgi:hypothetical protein